MGGASVLFDSYFLKITPACHFTKCDCELKNLKIRVALWAVKTDAWGECAVCSKQVSV